MQKVEDTVLGSNKERGVKSVGARVREIITENLQEPDTSKRDKINEDVMAKSLQVIYSIQNQLSLMNQFL